MTLDELLNRQFQTAEDFISKLASAPAGLEPVYTQQPTSGGMAKQAEAGEITIPTEEVLKLAQLCELAGNQLEKTAGEDGATVPPLSAGGSEAPALKDPNAVSGQLNVVNKAETASTLAPQQGAVGDTKVDNTADGVTPPGEGETMEVSAAAWRIFNLVKQAEQDPTAVPRTDTDPNAAKVDSPEKVKDLKPAEAAQQEADDLRGYLNEPGLSNKKDPTLDSALEHVSEAGPKIAAARAYLEKVAAEGCTCNGQGTCTYCLIKEALATDLEGTAAEGLEETQGDVDTPQQTPMQPPTATQSIRF